MDNLLKEIDEILKKYISDEDRKLLNDILNLSDEVNNYKKQVIKLKCALENIKEILLMYGETFSLDVHKEMQGDILNIIDKASK